MMQTAQVCTGTTRSARSRIVLRSAAGLLCMLLTAGAVYAQDAGHRNIRFERLSQDAINQTSIILQDHEGFLWLGQRATGLFRYDGYTLHRYVTDPDDPTSLSSAGIWSLYEDHQGVLWVGTSTGGVNRFDRDTETFTRYQFAADDPTSLSHDRVRDITEDHAGTLWVATDSGLNRFDRETETFTRFYPDPADPASPVNFIRTLLVDRQGTLWAGAWGVNQFDPATGTFRSYLPAPDVPAYVRENPDTFVNVVWSLLQDQAGRLWAGTEHGGLYEFTPPEPGQQATFTNYRNPPHTARGKLKNIVWDHGIPHNADIIFDLIEDPEGGFWVSTWGEGLLWFDPDTGGRTAFMHDPLDPFSLSGNHVTGTHLDRQGILWVGVMDGNVNAFDRASRPFDHIYSRNGVPDALNDNFVMSISEAPDGILWISAGLSNNRGINRFDRRTNQYRQFVPDPNDPHSVQGSFPVFVMRSGTVWVGGGDGVLSYMEPDRVGHFTHLRHRPADPRSLPPNGTTSLFEDRQGTLWVGTREFGLSRLDDRAQGLFTHYPIDANVMYMNSFYEDEAGTLWLGTLGDGLYRFDPATETFTHYPQAPSTPGVYGICGHEGAPDVIWVGVYQAGLMRMDTRTGTTTLRTMQNSALPDNGIQGVLCDDLGRVWTSTDNGVARYDPATDTFKNYGTGDGLQSLVFNSWAYHKSPYTGEMFFGGPEGLNAFHPDQIRDNPNPPEVILTGLRLFDEPVAIGPDAPLKRRLSKTEALTFGHRQNDLTFEYVGLHYQDPANNRYRYRLDGYDATWREAGVRREATYTNLPPGSYVFRVKAANSDGVWNEQGATVRLTITPPWWRTPWAYLLYGLLFAGVVFGIDRAQRRRLLTRARIRESQLYKEAAESQARALEAENRQKILELENAREFEALNTQLEAKNRELRALDQFKSRFFANVSHEFRTPLTLIVGPLEDLLEGEYGVLDADARESVGLAVENSRRLLHLVNQLLDISRLEDGRLVLHVGTVDAAAFVGQLAQRFEALAARKDIDFQVTVPTTRVWGHFDVDQIEKVLANLLGNAFKFTPTGGTISVHLTTEDDPDHDGWLVLRVHDTGPGIAPKHLPHLFERFYQADPSSTRQQSGTGIGLALVHELVALHKGRIDVESTVGEGTTFTLRLRLGTAHLPALEKTGAGAPPQAAPSAVPAFAHLAGEILVADDEAPLTNGNGAEHVPEGEDVTTVLVVDDNAQVRAYIRRYLGRRYRVLEAGDGQAALALAETHLPDLVVSDVMMPRMNGLALCRALKTNPELDFIPVILLTAKASVDSKIKGLETRADDYITKPFNVRELVVRVDNLIASRRQLKTRYSRDAAPAAAMPTPPGASAEDQAFLEAVHDTITTHLSQEGFGAAELAAALGQSRASLYRKFDKLLDQSPTDLIWHLRLTEAARLLQAREGAVGEVAYSVGFKSVSHFSKRFREAFGVTPVAYMAGPPQKGQQLPSAARDLLL